MAQAQRHEESCLSVDRAFELVMGRLAAHDAQRARAHAVQCAECLSLLGEVASRNEPTRGSGRDTSGTTPAALATGGLVGGRYRIVGRIGEGASCIVYRGVDDLPGRPIAVAIKVFRRSYLSRPSARQRVAREREALARLSSLRPRPTAELIAHGELAGCPFLVLELAESSLREELDRAGVRALGARLGDAVQLASALAMVHEAGLVHADVKPANVLRALDGRLVMSDFGLVEAEGDAMTNGVRRGTAMYMAPEHIRGAAPDARSDLYALGLVLHELFFGTRPEVNERAPTEHLLIAPRSPTRAELAVFELCRACCAPDPWDRPASARDVALRLARIAAREGQPVKVALPPLARPRWQRALAIISLASCVAFALGAVGARAWLSEPPARASEPEPASEPAHTPEPEPEHMREPEPEHTPEPEHMREPEPEPEHTPEPEHVREPEHTREPEPRSARAASTPDDLASDTPEPTASIVIDGGGTVDLWIAAPIPARWSYCPALATRPLVRGAPPYRTDGLVGSFWTAPDRTCLELADGGTLIAYTDHAVDAVSIGRWSLEDGQLRVVVRGTSTSLAGTWGGTLADDRVSLVEATSHQVIEHRRELPSPERPTGGESARLVGFDSSRSGMGAVDLASAYEPIRARIDACFAAAAHVPEPHEEVDWRVRMDVTGRVIDAWRLHGTGHDGHSLPTSVSHDGCVREALLEMTIRPLAH